MIGVDVQLDRGGFSLDMAFESETSVTGAFGPSGAGKTTLINLIAGLERPDRGSITVNGTTLFDSDESIDVPAHRRRIGVVFQEHRLFPHYSVTGNLLYGAGRDRSRLDSIVDLLELRPLLDRRVIRLSGGERQRVGLGRALLSDPRVLLLDEPLASLDRRLRQQILPYLRRVQEKLSLPILYVSHELPEVLQVTDELLVLDRGRVAGHGRYADLVHEDAALAVVHDRGMTNVLRGRVKEHHREDGISVIETVPGDASADRSPPAELLVALLSTEAGEEVTVAVDPWDIALAARPVQGVSIQNQIRGTVARCTTHDRRAIVHVNVGARLIVEISRKSAAAMGIEPGAEVTCLIKSHAIRALEAGDPIPAS